MRTRYLILLAAVVFAVGLFVQIPAAHVYGWVHAASPSLPVTLYGVDGTVVHGRSDEVTVQGRPLLTGLRWQLRAPSLLIGRASYTLSSDNDPLLIDGVAAAGLGGSRLTDFKARGDVRKLAAVFGQAFMPVTGQVGLDLDLLRMRNAWPVEVEGRVAAIELAWALGPEPVRLGNYEATLSNEGDDLLALISTLDGNLEINGDARLKPDRSYELRLQLRPRPNAPPLLNNMLRSLGQPDPQGYFQLQRKGQVPA